MSRLIVFILPFLMLLGVAIQTPAIYLAAVFSVILVLSASKGCDAARALMRKQGASLLALWMMSPAFNLIHKAVGTHDFDLSWKQLFSGSLSSSVFVVSCVLFMGSFANKRTGATVPTYRYGKAFSTERLLWAVVAGVAVGTLLLFPVLAYEAFTGQILGIKGHTPGKMTETGLYRISGYFGNSLWLSSVSLMFFAWNWSITWNVISNISQKCATRDLPDAGILRLYSMPLFRISVVSSSFLHFLIVILASGRTSIFVLLVATVFIPFIVSLAGAWKRIRFLATTGIACAASTMIFIFGFGDRFGKIAEGFFAGRFLDERATIWRVHFEIFRDHWLLGVGPGWLKHGVREFYYKSLVDAEIFGRIKGHLAHNLFLQVLCEFGVVGFLLLMGIVFSLFWILWRAAKEHALSRIVFKAFVLAVFVNMLHGTTENTFHASNIIIPTLFLMLVTLWVVVVSENRVDGGAKALSIE